MNFWQVVDEESNEYARSFGGKYIFGMLLFRVENTIPPHCKFGQSKKASVEMYVTVEGIRILLILVPRNAPS